MYHVQTHIFILLPLRSISWPVHRIKVHNIYKVIQHESLRPKSLALKSTFHSTFSSFCLVLHEKEPKIAPLLNLSGSFHRSTFMMKNNAANRLYVDSWNMIGEIAPYIISIWIFINIWMKHVQQKGLAPKKQAIEPMVTNLSPGIYIPIYIYIYIYIQC